MSTTDQSLFALPAYKKNQSEFRQIEGLLPVAAELSTLEIPAEPVATLPGGSLLLGLAEDGLPLLLDLYDAAPGPLLVAGDGGSGKTTFLQSLAQASDLQNPGEVQFGVLTDFPEEWTSLETLPNCLGIWPTYHSGASTFLSRLVSWADVLPDSRQAVLVLFDGLDLLNASGFQIRHQLRWLLMYGPERHLWPVVTVNAGRLNRLQTWLDYFRTRIFGQVKHLQLARLLGENPEINLAALLPGKQFGLSRPEGWLKFQLPTVE
jgi:hypothetical protein